MYKEVLSIETLTEACVKRIPHFKDAQGNVCHSKVDGSDWTPNDWMTALVGEVGEAANILKKIKRGDFTLAEVKTALGYELADGLIYLVMLAERLGIDLGQITVEKFNKVSDKVGAPVYLEPGQYQDHVIRTERSF